MPQVSVVQPIHPEAGARTIEHWLCLARKTGMLSSPLVPGSARTNGTILFLMQGRKELSELSTWSPLVEWDWEKTILLGIDASAFPGYK